MSYAAFHNRVGGVCAFAWREVEGGPWTETHETDAYGHRMLCGAVPPDVTPGVRSYAKAGAPRCQACVEARERQKAGGLDQWEADLRRRREREMAGFRRQEAAREKRKRVRRNRARV